MKGISKMKKVLLAFVLAVAMIVNILAMASCGPQASSGKLDPLNEGYNGSEVTITFYHTMSATNLQPVLNDAIERFNVLYPKITIDHKQVGDYDAVRDQIKTELTVGAQPNIAYCYPDHVALFKSSKKVIVLDDFINSTVTVNRADGTTEQMGYTQAQIDDFIEGYYNEGKSFGDGKMYTLPFLKSTEVLYYNKTAFDNWANIYNSEKLLDAEGNEVENPNYHNEAYNIKVPTTWDEMEETCAKIKALEPNSTPLGYDSEANWFITMCEQLKSGYTSAEKVNGTNYLFDNEANWAFVEKFASWYAKGYVTTKELSGGYTSELFKLAEDAVGKSYMSIGSSAGATHQAPEKEAGKYPFEVDITTVPQINAAEPKVISQGPSVCLFENADPQTVYASWLFVKFLTTDVQFQAEFSEASGYVPVLKSVAEDEYYAEFLANADGTLDGIAALSAKVCMEQVDAYYVSPAFRGSSTARDEVGLLMQACFSEYGAAVDKLAMIKQKFDEAIEECEY